MIFLVCYTILLRSSRVAGNAGEQYRPQQGHFVEIPGRLTDRGQSSTPPPSPPSPPRRYLRPQVKSLGTPDQPTKTSTAIQLEAGPGPGNEITWQLARWALRMKSDSSFPVTAAGVGVPSPGLYLAYAQITYLDKHKQQGFSILVNDNVAIECQENRGEPYLTYYIVQMTEPFIWQYTIQAFPWR